MANGTGHGAGHGRQLAIVGLLIGLLILLHWVALPSREFDPTAMLAFGFIVLASYTIGHLVDFIRLPHITGYLLAGMIFGPSIPHLLEGWGIRITLAPLDRGILNEDVLGMLSVLDTLAVALIAMTAGGELKLEALRRGLRAIVGVLAGQMVLIFGLVTGFVVLISGSIPALMLPGIGTLDGSAAVALGMVVASISIATSPAATIAVINDLRARGPMSRTVLSTVVLKDVVVVVTFSVASVFASRAMGLGGEQDLGRFLLIHILGSMGAGILLGSLFALYLRYVGREVLLVIVGMVYAATLVATNLHLDPVLLFIAAGFTVSNNPFFREGDRFIHSVEQLSMPVYVVFFTLAGAKLHIDTVITMAPFALGLVGLRVLALWVGVGIGGRVGGADPATRKHGWLGFVSQAGVAISLAAIVADNFGQAGAALSTLIIAGVAINELIGPVALKVSLGLAGEVRGDDEEPRSASSAPKVVVATKVERERLGAWAEPSAGAARWGPAPNTASNELNAMVHELRGDLATIVRDVARGPLAQFRRDAESYVQELRREFLRHHRRLVVQARDEAGSGELAQHLHAEESELADRWRGIVLGRGGRLPGRGWSPDRMVEAFDRLASSQAEVVEAPWEPESFLPRKDDGPVRALRRRALRTRRALSRLFDREMSPRKVPFSTLVRYHLSGVAPTKLESLAALLVRADTHLAARTRSLFDGIVQAYDRLAEHGTHEPGALESELRSMRLHVDEELSLALDEVAHMVRDGERRAEEVVAEALAGVTAELGTFGTLDLPTRRRRSSRLFRERMRALDLLGDRLTALRETAAGIYSLLGLELELVGLEARVKDALDDHVTALEHDVDGRAHVQAQRLEGALAEARDHMGDAIESEQGSATDLSVALRQLAAPLEKITAEASRAAMQLRDQLSAEPTVAPLLDALRRASGELTDRYEVPSAPLLHGDRKLPVPVPLVDVPFRMLVAAHVEAELAPRLLNVTRELASSVVPYLSSLQELERIVAFNVELSSAELEVLHDEPVTDATRALLEEMLLGALERNRELAHGHVEATAGWAGGLGDALRKAVLGGIDTLRRQLVEGDLTQARIDTMRRRAVGKKLIRRAETIPWLLERSGALFRRTVRGLVGDERLDNWRRLMGLPAPTATAPEATAFAPPRAGEHLPLVYRRLFAAETLEAGDVLTGREAQIGRASRALEGSGLGNLRSVALVGLDGVGKGTLSRAIVRNRRWKNVRRMNLKGPVTREQVNEWFLEGSEGHLVVISGFHWLVAMRAGGFAALRRFVDGVIEDGGHNAFLLHADLMVWEYACRVAPLADAFPEVVVLEPLGPDELEAALIARHNLSGFGLNFDPHDTDSRLEKLFARGASRIRRPYENFFQALHTSSGGLVRDAIRLWLASVDGVDEAEDFVRVGPVPPSPQGAVRRLSEDVLLNLYQIARQGWMDAAVQAHLFRVDAVTAEAQLSRLAHLGLLQRHGAAYRIAPHLRGPIYRVLKERGWVR